MKKFRNRKTQKKHLPKRANMILHRGDKDSIIHFESKTQKRIMAKGNHLDSKLGKKDKPS